MRAIRLGRRHGPEATSVSCEKSGPAVNFGRGNDRGENISQIRQNSLFGFLKGVKNVIAA
jgi:hypothetical protein